MSRVATIELVYQNNLADQQKQYADFLAYIAANQPTVNGHAVPPGPGATQLRATTFGGQTTIAGPAGSPASMLSNPAVNGDRSWFGGAGVGAYAQPRYSSAANIGVTAAATISAEESKQAVIARQITTAMEARLAALTGRVPDGGAIGATQAQLTTVPTRAADEERRASQIRGSMANPDWRLAAVITGSGKGSSTPPESDLGLIAAANAERAAERATSRPPGTQPDDPNSAGSAGTFFRSQLFRRVSSGFFAYHEGKEAIEGGVHVAENRLAERDAIRYGGTGEQLSHADQEAREDNLDRGRRILGMAGRGLATVPYVQNSPSVQRMSDAIGKWGENSSVDAVMRAKESVKDALASSRRMMEDIALTRGIQAVRAESRVMSIRANPFLQQRAKATEEYIATEHETDDRLQQLKEAAADPSLSPQGRVRAVKDQQLYESRMPAIIAAARTKRLTSDDGAEYEEAMQGFGIAQRATTLHGQSQEQALRNQFKPITAEIHEMIRNTRAEIAQVYVEHPSNSTVDVEARKVLIPEIARSSAADLRGLDNQSAMAARAVHVSGSMIYGDIGNYDSSKDWSEAKKLRDTALGSAPKTDASGYLLPSGADDVPAYLKRLTDSIGGLSEQAKFSQFPDDIKKLTTGATPANPAGDAAKKFAVAGDVSGDGIGEVALVARQIASVLPHRYRGDRPSAPSIFGGIEQRDALGETPSIAEYARGGHLDGQRHTGTVDELMKQKLVQTTYPGFKNVGGGQGPSNASSGSSYAFETKSGISGVLPYDYYIEGIQRAKGTHQEHWPLTEEDKMARRAGPAYERMRAAADPNKAAIVSAARTAPHIPEQAKAKRQYGISAREHLADNAATPGLTMASDNGMSVGLTSGDFPVAENLKKAAANYRADLTPQQREKVAADESHGIYDLPSQNPRLGGPAIAQRHFQVGNSDTPSGSTRVASAGYGHQAAMHVDQSHHVAPWLREARRRAGEDPSTGRRIPGSNAPVVVATANSMEPKGKGEAGGFTSEQGAELISYIQQMNQKLDDALRVH